MTNQTEAEKHLQNPDLSFNIAQVIFCLKVVELRLHATIQSPTIHYSTKDMLRRQERSVVSILREWKSLMKTPETREIYEKEVEKADNLQYQYIYNMMLALPEPMRDQVETYVRGLYDVYRLNRGENEQV